MRIPRNYAWAVSRAREIWVDEGMSGLRYRSTSYLQRRRMGATSVTHRLPVGPSRSARWPLSVVMIAAGAPVQCFHYRVEQKMQICRELTVPFRVVDPALTHEVEGAVQIASHVIVFRQAAGPAIEAAVAHSRRLGVPLIYEADDAVYRRDLLEGNPNLDTIPRSLRSAVLTGADGYLAGLRQADHVLASTQALAEDMGQLVSGRSFVVENGIDRVMQGIVAGLAHDPAPPPRPPDSIIIGYGSGSRAHDWDLAVAAPGLEHLMATEPRVHLHLIGPVAVPASLRRFDDRILRTTELNYPEYLRQLAACDVTIAPLSDIPFNRYKSQIKYLEAGLVGVPLIASPTVYADYVTDGSTGLLAAPNEWSSALSTLVRDAQMRRDISAAARADIAESMVDRRPRRQFADMLESLS